MLWAFPVLSYWVLICFRRPRLLLLEKALRLAHRHARQSKTLQFSCFFIGTLSVDGGEYRCDARSSYLLSGGIYLQPITWKNKFLACRWRRCDVNPGSIRPRPGAARLPWENSICSPPRRRSSSMLTWSSTCYWQHCELCRWLWHLI